MASITATVPVGVTTKVIADNATKKYQISTCTVEYHLSNTTDTAMSANFRISGTSNGASTELLYSINVPKNYTINGTVTFSANSYITNPGLGLFCRADGLYITGTTVWTITYTEINKPSVSAGTPIRASQITDMSNWRGYSVGTATQGSVIDNASMSSVPTEGSTIAASYYNNL